MPTNCSKRCALTPLRAVRVDLALRALVRAEDLEPTDEEIDEEFETTAEAMKSTPEILRANLRDTGRDRHLSLRGRQDEGLTMAERSRHLRRPRGSRDRSRPLLRRINLRISTPKVGP